MTKEATLISFKDLMQAKMEREQQREVEDTSLPVISEEIINPSPEYNAAPDAINQEQTLPRSGIETEKQPTYLPTTHLSRQIPTYLSINLPTYLLILILFQCLQSKILQKCQIQLNEH
jgi:hypothetical protein